MKAHGLGFWAVKVAEPNDHFGVTDDVDPDYGTFSKSLAAIGVYRSRWSIVSYLRHNSRSYVSLTSDTLPQPLPRRAAQKSRRRVRQDIPALWIWPRARLGFRDQVRWSTASYSRANMEDSRIRALTGICQPVWLYHHAHPTMHYAWTR